MKTYNIPFLVLFLSLALVACDNKEEKKSDTRDSAQATVISPDTNIMDEELPELIPPEPGEVGGLPDDRTLLDESPIDPATVRGAGLVLEQ